LVIGPAATGRARAQPPPPSPSATREAELEARLRQLEALMQKMPDPEYVRKLEAKLKEMPDPEEVRRMQTTIRQLSDQVRQLQSGSKERDAAAVADVGRLPRSVPTPIRGMPGSVPFATAASEGAQMPAPPITLPLRAVFGNGFQLATEDDEFLLQYNNFTLIDGRINLPQHQSLVSDGVGFPLALNSFSGRFTRLVEFNATIGNTFTEPGANTFKTVFLYANLHFDDRFMIRAGKQRVPFTYEFALTPFSGLINLDYSLFFQNLSTFSATGYNAHGQLFDHRLSYSIGVFDAPLPAGGPNPLDYVDLYALKSAIGQVNLQPFLYAGVPWLERLNVGGSVDAGYQSGNPAPQPLVAGIGTYGIPFLVYNQNVRQSGHLAYWALSAAYFYRHLSILAEWESGVQNFSRIGQPGRTPLGIDSYYVQAAYLLTGETVVGRGMVKPLRPFDLRHGHFGPGAWELAARYNPFEVGSAVFTHGLADPNLWTNRLWVLDLGANWYWNENLKLSLGWKHAEFGEPVFRNAGRLQRTAEQVVLRAAIVF
jgi:phosphate-selective porin OprO/OprP